MDSKPIIAKGETRILLMTLPFLTPLIPPVGISCLKSYLERNGYPVKTIDAMADMELRELCYRYFDTLERFIPEKKRGFFFNIALDVLFNHFMAHTNYVDKRKYLCLVHLLVAKNFFVYISDKQVRQLNDIVVDFFRKLETYVLENLEKIKPSIVGLSVYKGTLAASLFTGKLIKETYPDIKVVMGGTIFSQELYPGTPNYNLFVERAIYIDKLFVGESEQLFLKYLQNQLPGNKKLYTLEDIGSQLLDLNTLDLPDYSDFDLSVYPLLPAFTSRGCVYRCSFCAETVYWKRYNRKSVKKVADEFQQLSRKYKKNLFVLTDCLINPMVTTLSKELIARALKLYWDVYIKVDKHVCEPEYTMLWRRGGFYRARLGIESGSQNLLNIIDKKVTVEQIKIAITNLAAVGIKTTTYWIAGHPGETEADFRMTLDLLEELQDDIFEAECDPFRYFYTGQVNSKTWNKEKGNQLLYPADASDMLITQTWTLNEFPPREVIYEREFRFKEHCIKLGIPNPYSISELIEADKRWRLLHRNAVPPVMELNNNRGEKKHEMENVPRIRNAQNLKTDNIGFNF